MSEEFDKEAEREKLREKYGEADDREATRQMSELLLKGATMTNRHCDTCGDPVFRYDGQEFCPTCQGTGETAQDTPPETAAEPGVEEQPTGDEPEPQPAAGRETTPAGRAHGRHESAGDESRRQRESPERQPTASAPAPAEGDRDLAAARASLERTLTRFARAAGATEDPRAARERLVAAREAAEALSTLRR